MATWPPVALEFETARKLVYFLEDDGFKLQAAVFALNDEGRGRLYLVPVEQDQARLDQMVEVAHVVSKHRDELPGRHELLYSVVKADNPVVQAVMSATPSDGPVRGVSRHGTYVDEAYVLHRAA
jgi:hypothetical protein